MRVRFTTVAVVSPADTYIGDVRWQAYYGQIVGKNVQPFVFRGYQVDNKLHYKLAGMVNDQFAALNKAALAQANQQVVNRGGKPIGP